MPARPPACSSGYACALAASLPHRSGSPSSAGCQPNTHSFLSAHTVVPAPFCAHALRRLCLFQVLDEVSKHSKPRWVRTTVNLDDHIIFPDLDPTATSDNPDQVVEDYLSSLSTLAMDHSRPLWEFHVLDFPTSEATATVAVRMHHSLGDGVSLLSLLIACTRSAADPARLPALPSPSRRAGPVYARPRPPLSAGFVAFVVWIWSYAVLAWHTLVDVVCFVATSWFLRDARTPFMGSEGVEFRRKRFVHCTLSLDDVKLLKNAMKL